jgi:hypothetical protein
MEFILLIATVAACNTKGNYLCAGVACTVSSACQSDCCWDGVCNINDSCGARQLEISVVVLSILGAVSLILYILLHVFYCKAKY